MSAAHRSEPSVAAAAQAPRDMTQLQSRRREANRRRRLLRLDVALGLLGGIVLLVATPGLAIAAIFVGLLLVACVVSVLAQRRRERRGAAEARRSV